MKHPDRRTVLRAATAFAAAGGVTALAATAPATQSSPVKPGGAAFDWPALSLLDGTLLPPGSWQDSGAILVFWATHCPYCRRHNQHVEKLHRSLAGRAVRVLGLASDRDPAVVRGYMQQQGLSFAVSMQAELMRMRLGLGRTLPTTITLDRKGRPGLAIPGEMFEDDVLELARIAAA